MAKLTQLAHRLSAQLSFPQQAFSRWLLDDVYNLDLSVFLGTRDALSEEVEFKLSTGFMGLCG